MGEGGVWIFYGITLRESVGSNEKKKKIMEDTQKGDQ